MFGKENPADPRRRFEAAQRTPTGNRINLE